MKQHYAFLMTVLFVCQSSVAADTEERLKIVRSSTLSYLTALESMEYSYSIVGPGDFSTNVEFLQERGRFRISRKDQSIHPDGNSQLVDYVTALNDDLCHHKKTRDGDSILFVSDRGELNGKIAIGIDVPHLIAFTWLEDAADTDAAFIWNDLVSPATFDRRFSSEAKVVSESAKSVTLRFPQLSVKRGEWHYEVTFAKDKQYYPVSSRRIAIDDNKVVWSVQVDGMRTMVVDNEDVVFPTALTTVSDRWGRQNIQVNEDALVINHDVDEKRFTISREGIGTVIHSADYRAKRRKLRETGRFFAP